jgi:hypothetical protein
MRQQGYGILRTIQPLSALQKCRLMLWLLLSHLLQL